MTMDRKIRLIAGTLILISLALGVWVSEWWLLFTAFIGVNLVQSSITNWCLMEDILRAAKIHAAPEAPAQLADGEFSSAETVDATATSTRGTSPTL